jgi:hypothetical protein
MINVLELTFQKQAILRIIHIFNMYTSHQVRYVILNICKHDAILSIMNILNTEIPRKENAILNILP